MLQLSQLESTRRDFAIDVDGPEPNSVPPRAVELRLTLGDVTALEGTFDRAAANRLAEACHVARQHNARLVNYGDADLPRWAAARVVQALAGWLNAPELLTYSI